MESWDSFVVGSKSKAQIHTVSPQHIQGFLEIH